MARLLAHPTARDFATYLAASSNLLLIRRPEDNEYPSTVVRHCDVVRLVRCALRIGQHRRRFGDDVAGDGLEHGVI